MQCVWGGLCSFILLRARPTWSICLSSPPLFLLFNWALALMLSLYLNSTLYDLTLLVLSWLWKQWNLSLIYETKTCFHHFSRGKHCSSPTRSFWAERMLNIRGSARGASFKCELHKRSNSLLEVPMRESSTQIILWLMFKGRHFTILAETFILSCKFQKNMLVTRTNN